MEGFTSSFISFSSSSSKPSSISSSFIADTNIIDHQNMELLINPSFTTQYDLLNTTITSQSSFINNDMNFFSQLPSAVLDHHHQLLQSFQPAAVFQHDQKKNVSMLIPDQQSAAGAELKRKTMNHVSSSTNSNSGNSSVPENENIDEKRYQSSLGRKGKKAKVISEINGETSKEVVHVRARRGQATDSHSIAERVRRGKINERLRCLQDIVPGCYKSMGMAVMLDEIISYVQSLQNQVEFLSMKLTEASRFHSFDSDLMHMDVLQMGNVIEGLRMQRLEEREEIGLVDQSFGSYPSLPYHTT